MKIVVVLLCGRKERLIKLGYSLPCMKWLPEPLNLKSINKTYAFAQDAHSLMVKNAILRRLNDPVVSKNGYYTTILRL